MASRPKVHRFDPRSWQQRLRDHYIIWGMIFGLCAELIIWALIAYASIGNRTIHVFKYYIADPTPAAVPYNRVAHRTGEQSQ